MHHTLNIACYSPITSQKKNKKKKNSHIPFGIVTVNQNQQIFCGRIPQYLKNYIATSFTCSRRTLLIYDRMKIINFVILSSMCTSNVNQTMEGKKNSSIWKLFFSSSSFQLICMNMKKKKFRSCLQWRHWWSNPIINIIVSI